MQDSLNILLAPCIERSEDFIEHHGVKGMHWGVRKQKAYERRSKRYDSLRVREAQNLASVYGHAIEYSKKRMNKNSVKKDPLKAKAAKETYQHFSKNYSKLKKEAIRKTKDFTDKYGKTKLSEIKYSKKGILKQGPGMRGNLYTWARTLRLGDGSEVVVPIQEGLFISPKRQGRIAATTNYRSRQKKSNWMYKAPGY